jgi:3-hydroxyisobutyrate dehydrogenase-like beta-hydroxyacid dehydrogenase
MNIGFIGFGIMGSAMAANLAKAGYRMAVHNRTKQKAEPILSQNVIWKHNPAELAAEVDIVFTMLSTPDVVYDVSCGENGFLTALKSGSIWVDCSTVNPSFSREMAERCSEYSVGFIDAPVSGSKIPAEKGELLFLVGGDADHVKGCAPYFDVMGKKYVHVGDNGMGSAMKMVVNLILGEAMFAFSEGLVLGEALGIGQKMLFDVLLGSPVVAPLMALKREKIEKADYSPEFPLQWQQKDLHLASLSAFEQGISLPGVNVIKEIYALAKQHGFAESDISAIYKFLKGKKCGK